MTKLRFAIYGLALGFALSRMGFSHYDEVHKMFTFGSLRLLLAFCAAVALLAAMYFYLGRRQQIPGRPLHKGSLIGGILFGAGWVLTGACPSIVLVQLGEGQLAALATIPGVLLGTWIYPMVHARVFRWDRGSCEM